MFHISLLKKTIGNYNEEEELPDHLEGDGHDIVEHDIVLASRRVQKGSKGW